MQTMQPSTRTLEYNKGSRKSVPPAMKTNGELIFAQTNINISMSLVKPNVSTLTDSHFESLYFYVYDDHPNYEETSLFHVRLCFDSPDDAR